MNATIIATYSDTLSKLCAMYGVKRLALFGSAARNDFDMATSDLDFLIEFSEHQVTGAFDRYFGLKEALEQLFQRPVDLVEYEAIRNPYFHQAIERDKIVVYET